MYRNFALLCAAFLFSSQVSAAQDSGLHWGLMAGSSSYDETNGRSYGLSSITVRGIYNVNSYFGLEARGVSGGSDSSNSIEMKMNWLGGVYAKASWEVMDRLVFTAYGGYSTVDTTATGFGVESSGSDSGASYGLSMDMYANSDRGLNLEWMRYMDSTQRGYKYVIDHVGFGYFQKF